MKKSYHLIVQVLFLLIMAGVAMWAYPLLPDQIATHWNLAGEADGRGSKRTLLLGIPLVTFFVLVLMKVLPSIDPKKKKYALFTDAYNGMQTVFTFFFMYLFGVSIYSNLHTTPSMAFFMLIGLGILFICMGTYMGKIRQNYFVGLKTPRTLSNEIVWNKSHRFMGILRVIGGIILLIEAFLQRYISVVFIITLVALIVVPIVYSYVAYRKLGLLKKE